MIRTLARAAAILLALALLSPFAAALAQTPPPPPPPPPGGWGDTPPLPPRVVDPRLRQREPSMKTQMRVRYPEAEACMRISGTVTLIVSIGTEGEVLDVQIERSTRNRNLDRAAVAAARETRWTPEIFNGKPTPSRGRIPVEFVLPEISSENCQRVSVALVDAEGAAQLTPPPAGQPLRAKIGLYVPAPLELKLVLRHAAPAAGSDAAPYAVVHEERRSLERPARVEMSNLDFATPEPLSAGPYLLEIWMHGGLVSSTPVEVR
jgi:TonB family protein